jgi:cell division protein FtsB
MAVDLKAIVISLSLDRVKLADEMTAATAQLASLDAVITTKKANVESLEQQRKVLASNIDDLEKLLKIAERMLVRETEGIKNV